MRVAYVVHAAASGVAPANVIDRWPTMARTLDALAKRGVDVVAVCATDGPSELIERGGVRYRFVHDRSRWRWSVARAVRDERVDVVHVNGFIYPLPTLALRAAGVGRRAAIVVQHHGEAPGRGRTRLAQQASAAVIDGVLFTGARAGQAEPFRRARMLPARAGAYEVLEASADLQPIDRDRARVATGVLGEPALLWVGRLNEGKDPLTAVAAFAAFAGFAEQRSGAELWMLYNDAPLEGAVRAALDAADPEIAKRVHLVGQVDHADIASWYSAADIFISCSRHEGSGFALFESLACGCTPVVSDIAPHRVIVGDLAALSQHGVFAVGNVVAAADALAHASAIVAADPARQRTLIRDDFERRLGWDVVARQLVAAYEAALGRVHTRARTRLSLASGWLMPRRRRPRSWPS